MAQNNSGNSSRTVEDIVYLVNNLSGPIITGLTLILGMALIAFVKIPAENQNLLALLLGGGVGVGGTASIGGAASILSRGQRRTTPEVSIDTLNTDNTVIQPANPITQPQANQPLRDVSDSSVKERYEKLLAQMDATDDDWLKPEDAASRSIAPREQPERLVIQSDAIDADATDDDWLKPEDAATHGIPLRKDSEKPVIQSDATNDDWLKPEDAATHGIPLRKDSEKLVTHSDATNDDWLKPEDAATEPQQ